jgi:hypothetical protein
MSSRDARAKLVRMLGESRADSLIAEISAERGLSDLESADSRYLFASSLIARGGVLEAVGRAIRVQALLQGARANEDQKAL